MDFYLENAIKMYPNASCELIYHSNFEFLVCVVLSAQTTDKAVNKISPSLFSKYPTELEMSKALYEDLYDIIKPLGLAKNKTKSLIELSNELVMLGEIPSNVKDLVKLPGVGIKTANVYMSEIYKEPHIAVDTHVSRVSKRLGFAKEDDDPIAIEEILEKRYPKKMWITVHHTYLFLGRYCCKSNHPLCETCLLNKKCKYFRNKED